jgi:CRP/FNR family transcriptional regulator
MIVAIVDVRFLHTLPYFQEFSLTELARIGSQVHQRNFEANEMIYLAEQPVEAFYVVRHGRARVFESSAEGKEQVLFVVGQGATFNDAAVFDGGPNLASAQAIDPGAVLYVLPASLMARLAATDLRVTSAAIRTLASRARHFATLAADLSLQHLTQRVAKLLLEESRPAGGVTLTKQEIGTRVGTVREVVSRELRRLEQIGTITRGRDGIVQVDRQALNALLGSPEIAVTSPEERLAYLIAS